MAIKTNNTKQTNHQSLSWCIDIWSRYVDCWVMKVFQLPAYYYFQIVDFMWQINEPFFTEPMLSSRGKIDKYRQMKITVIYVWGK